MRKRVGALIIKDKKLLLVTGLNSNYYWSPGGTIEQNETDTDTLKRELDEELGVKLKSSKHYISMVYKDDNVSCSFYIVDTEGSLKPNNEVSNFIWYSKSNYEQKEPAISSWLVGEVMEKLIEDNYL